MSKKPSTDAPYKPNTSGDGQVKTLIEPTEEDNLNSDTYVEQRMKLFRLNTLHDYVPNVASTAVIEIRAATKLDYDFPVKFRDQAIIVQTRFKSRGCDLLNCLPVQPRGRKCYKSSPSRVFHTGDTTLAACQPACFNIVPNSVSDAVQSPSTAYFDKYDSCIINSTSFMAFGMDDYNRTDTHPKAGFDNIGTGFNIDEKTPLLTDKEGDVFTHFRINKYFCDRFHLNLDNEDTVFGNCADPFGRSVFVYTVGGYWYNMFAHFKDRFYDGIYINWPLPFTLPPLDNEKYPKEQLNLDEWTKARGNCRKINTNVLLSDLGITSATRHMTWTNEFSPEGNLVEPLLVYTSVPDVGFASNQNPLPTAFKKIDFTLQPNYIKKPNIPPNMRVQDTGFIKKNKTKTIRLPDIKPYQENWFERIVNSILSVEFLKNYLIQANVDAAIGFIQGLLLSLLKRLLPYIMTMVFRVVTNSILRAIILKVVTQTVLTSIVRGIFLASRAFTTASTTALAGLGVFLFFTIFLDLGLEIWDPLGVNRRIRPETITAYMQQGFEENFKIYGERTPVMSPDLLYMLFDTLIATKEEHESDLKYAKQNTNPPANPPANQPDTKPADQPNTKPADQANTEPTDQVNTDTKKRNRRAVTSTPSDPVPTVDYDGLNNIIKSDDKFHGFDDYGIAVVGKVDPSNAEGVRTIRQKLQRQMAIQTIVWSTQFLVAHDYNSEGSKYDWANKPLGKDIDIDQVQEHMDNTISDEFIENLLFSSEMSERMRQSAKLSKYINISLVSLMGAMLIQSVLVAVVLVFVLTLLIACHNFYILTNIKQQEFNQLQSKIKSQIREILADFTI